MKKSFQAANLSQGFNAARRFIINYGRADDTHHWRIHVFLEIRPTQSSIPVVRDVTSVHDLTEQIAQVFPRDLGIGLQVVVQHVDADREVADVERITAVPSLRTELTTLADDSVEVAQRE